MTRHTRRAGTRQIVLGAIALVTIVAAVVLFTRGGSKSDAATDQFVDFYCPPCDHAFKLSYRDFEQVWDKRQYKLAEGGGHDMLFKCEKCAQFTAERGTKPVARP